MKQNIYNFVKLSFAMKNRSQAPYRWANRSLLKPARDSNPESPDFCPKQRITWKIASALNTLTNRWMSTSYNKIRMEVNGTNPWMSQSPEDQDKGIPIYDLATVHKYIRGWGGKRTPKEQKGAEFQDSNENKEGSDDNYTMICDCAHIMIFVALECSWYSTVYKL